MPQIVAVDQRPAPEFLPLLPTDAHDLRHGLPFSPGADTARARTVDHEGIATPDGYKYESDERLVRRLIYRARSQGVWSDDEILDALLDPTNTGGAWLRRQDDPVGRYAELLGECYAPRAPRHSARQAVETVLQLTAGGGARLADLKRAVTFGKYSDGNVTQLVGWLESHGYVTSVRTQGPNGGVGKRTVQRTGKGLDRKIASAFNRVVSRGLHGFQRLSQALGHRSPEGGVTRRPTRKNILTDPEVIAAGERTLQGLKLKHLRVGKLRRDQREAARVEAQRIEDEYEDPRMTAMLTAVELDALRASVATWLAEDPDAREDSVGPTPAAPAPDDELERHLTKLETASRAAIYRLVAEGQRRPAYDDFTDDDVVDWPLDAHDAVAPWGIDAGHRALEATPTSTTPGRPTTRRRWATTAPARESVGL